MRPGLNPPRHRPEDGYVKESPAVMDTFGVTPAAKSGHLI
jgi:hypothetical protein